MTVADLPAVRGWLATPEVVRWWGHPDEQFALIREDLDNPAMTQFIVCRDGRGFGYLQCFDFAAWPNEAFGEQPPGTRAIDQFIGEGDMINRGHGSAFIREFVGDLFAGGAPRVLTDPDPQNRRAVRAYEKAGFTGERVVRTPEGPALLMVCNQ